jgi:hypothetical protein
VKTGSPHNGDYRRAAFGYEATREDAMAAFAKRLAQELRVTLACAVVLVAVA